MNEKSRTKLVSKRDSDKLKLDDKQIESDAGWLSRVKRSLSNFFTKEDDKVVQKREVSEKPVDANKSQEKLDLLNIDYKPPTRRRRQFEEEEDDDEDNDIASGDHETTPDPDPVTPLPPVKDDKYCKYKICCLRYRELIRLHIFGIFNYSPIEASCWRNLARPIQGQEQ